MDPYSASPRPSKIPLIAAIILAVLFFVTTVVFLMQYQQASTNLDGQIAEAVTAAEAAKTEELEADFAERIKEPHVTYTAPSDFSSVSVTYPKTWSTHVVAKLNSSPQIDGYFHPDNLPDFRGQEPFALRMTLENRPYAEQVRLYESRVKDGTLRSRAVTVNGVNGVRLDGGFENNKEGILVILPIRDKTLKVWTEHPRFAGDFTAVVLPKLTFNP